MENANRVIVLHTIMCQEIACICTMHFIERDTASFKHLDTHNTEVGDWDTLRKIDKRIGKQTKVQDQMASQVNSIKHLEKS